MDSNKLGPLQKTVVGAQFLFVAFGATVLVPLLVGLDPSVALMTTVVVSLFGKGLLRLIPIFAGIGGAELTIGTITIGGIGLAAVTGVILNLIIPRDKTAGING